VMTVNDTHLSATANAPRTHLLRRAALRVALFLSSTLLRLVRPVASFHKRALYWKFLQNFPLDSGDFFIVTYPRSGTTLLQMIAHELTSGPGSDFNHIDDVIPWFEVSGPEGRLGSAQPLARPRFFKTHLRMERLPRGPKYIYVARNVADVAISYFHHLALDGYSGPLDQFVQDFLRGNCPWGSWFEHVESGLKYRARKDVLFLTYEELVSDLEGTVRKIAKFAGIQLDEQKMSTLLTRCSIAYMREHETKFHPRLSGIKLGHFIRQGGVGTGAGELTSAQMDALKSKFLAKRAEWRLLDSGIDALVAPWLQSRPPQ
jgi:LPS sulfotransferase NodH